MHAQVPTLHILCGKIASGKSTLAARLSAKPSTVLITEDAWLDTLFRDELQTREDYVRCSRRIGHWAFLADGRYVGWGGFQREGDEWDFGLVLRPDAFGLGRLIARKAVDFAVADARIPFVTFLLPPSRKNLGALQKIGARPIGEIEYEGAKFLKFRLETESADLRTSEPRAHSGA